MIQWNDSFATGHELVDNDHKKLIEALNRLETALHSGAAKEQIGDIIAFLNSYAREHFAREEAHMLSVGCPAHAENKKAHAEFVAKLDGWVAKLGKGSSTAVVVEVYRETSAWIRNHILKVDCQLRGCRR
jgi:hemerythrin